MQETQSPGTLWTDFNRFAIETIDMVAVGSNHLQYLHSYDYGRNSLMQKLV
jgi:hypothetical protein